MSKTMTTRLSVLMEVFMGANWRVSDTSFQGSHWGCSCMLSPTDDSDDQMWLRGLEAKNANPQVGRRFLRESWLPLPLLSRWLPWMEMSRYWWLVIARNIGGGWVKDAKNWETCSFGALQSCLCLNLCRAWRSLCCRHVLGEAGQLSTGHCSFLQGKEHKTCFWHRRLEWGCFLARWPLHSLGGWSLSCPRPSSRLLL